MKRFFATLLLFLFVYCGGTGMVEIGVNDGPEKATLGTAGDISMRVLSIEIPESGGYTVLWDGVQAVRVSIESSDFVSITNRFFEVEPGSYEDIRVTVDSVQHVQDTLVVMLVDTAYQFVADAFTDIVIEENDEFQLVVGINTPLWFDPGNQEIRPGHVAFEGATLRIYYDL
jgi:hypothetical protein